MIHPDIMVTGIEKNSETFFVKGSFFVSCGNIFFCKFSLPGFHPGNMRVAVKGDSVRMEPRHLFKRVAHRFHGLPRETINKVVVDRGVSYLSRETSDLLNLFKRLVPVDEVLYLLIKILDPETHPSEPQIVQHLQMFSSGIRWVAFKAELMIFTDHGCP